MTKGNGAGFWLVVDPRREQGYTPATFDQAAFLARAAALFAGKPTWGGRRPEVVRAHPAQAGNGLEPAAQAVGLRVKADPLVGAGCYWLGLEVDK